MYHESTFAEFFEEVEKRNMRKNELHRKWSCKMGKRGKFEVETVIEVKILVNIR